MTAKIDKIILTNNTALTSKYGASGVRSVHAGIERLVVADRDRGLITRLIAIDDARAMREFWARAVTRGADSRQNKQAVDDLYAALAPDYILLLGSSDVIPQQPLRNPVYTTPKGDDDDPDATGDLPYACEAGYGRDIGSFIGPTRVVGRLPDIAGANEPSYLLRLLRTASAARPASPDAYRDHFALSAQIWEGSTRQSMRNIFGNSDGVLPVPPRSANWPANLLEKRMHFINCHGASRASEFFGQPASGKHQYPIALRASQIAGKIARGTVAAAECCYGGQLPRRSPTHTRPGICETYLGSGAWGFVGSSTIAYGDFERNGDADLVCQYFFENVLASASLGRAFLEARQKFVRSVSPLHPLDLKTLAQFNLYGDPSIVAVSTRGVDTSARVMDIKTMRAQRSARHDRRRVLFKQGTESSQHEPISRRTATTRTTSIKRSLYAKARQSKLKPKSIQSYAIRYRSPPQAMPRGLAQKSAAPTGYHILFCEPAVTARGATRRNPGVPNIIALIGKEVNGAVVSFARLENR